MGTVQYVVTGLQLASSINLPLGYIAVHSFLVCAGWFAGVSYCLGIAPKMIKTVMINLEECVPCTLKSLDEDSSESVGGGDYFEDLLVNRLKYVNRKIKKYGSDDAKSEGCEERLSQLKKERQKILEIMTS